MRAAITEAAGNEVFFVGRVEPDGRIQHVEVHCRGNERAVPAMLRAARPGDAVVHNHPSGNLTPSDADLRLASHYAQEGVAFLIIDNDAARAYAVVEPRKPQAPPWSDLDLERLFDPRGGLATALLGWEPRPGQKQMAAGVGTTQDQRGVYVVEAGTGTGKSLAYLLPSAVRAVRSGERVVVSTHTRHLQQQIVSMDVPTAKQLVPDLQVAILKGRSNYLCRRRLEERLAELPAEDRSPEAESLRHLGRWASTTEDGSKADLPFVPDPELWESVESDSELTLKFRCQHFDRCFYYESRRKAASAHVLVVNHHLLLADRRIRSDGGLPILPNYDHAVIDEAHHVEDVATDFAGEEVSATRIGRQIGRIRPLRGRDGGAYGRLVRPIDEWIVSQPQALHDPALSALRESLDALLLDVERVRHSIRLIFDEQLALLEPHYKVVEGAAPESLAPLTFRLQDDLESREPELVAALRVLQAEGTTDLLALVSRIEEIGQRREEIAEALLPRTRSAMLELAACGRRLQESATTLARVFTPDPDLCRWAELRRGSEGGRELRLVLRPIDVDQTLAQLVWKPLKSAVLTSATLSVDGRFEHLRRRLGLKDAEVGPRVRDEIVPSPFDYGRQVLLAVPSDLEDPSTANAELANHEATVRLIEAARGRTFVLLTSWRALRRAADLAKSRLGPGWTILRQGDLPTPQLVEVFRHTERAVIFGTDSFWEGVDVRGEALSLVILTKLPFRVPSEPLQVARADRVTERGGDAFADLAVPQAVVKFKQGFGRLIRHRDDRGAVVVLDPRVIRKRYGRTFLLSLPDGVRPFVRPLDEVVAEVRVRLAGGSVAEEEGGVADWGAAGPSDPAQPEAQGSADTIS